ncbi:MAG: hypothetical protein ACRCXQ_03135 [Vagococcus fluvialis]
MEKELSIWEHDEQILNEELVLDYNEYTDFNEKQDEIYNDLYTNKLLKNDSIKFY